MLAKQPLSQLS